MTAESPRQRSWLPIAVLGLVVVCTAWLAKSFWTQSESLDVPEVDSRQVEDEHLPKVSVEDAARVLADPQARALERAAALKTATTSGKQIVPHLVPLLQHASTEDREQVLELLRQLGPDAAEAAGPVRRLFADSEPRIREAAIRTASAIDPDTLALRAALFEALEAGPEAVSLRAIDALAELEPAPVDEFYALAIARSPLSDRATHHLRRFAIGKPQFLHRMLRDGLRFNGLPELREPLEDIVRTEPDDAIHLAALSALLQIDEGPSARRQARYFDELLDGAKRHRDAPEFLFLMGSITPFDDLGAPILLELLSSTHHRTRCRAAYDLALRSPKTTDLVPVLRECLKSDQEGTVEAVLAAASLRDDGKALIPELAALAKGSDSPAAVAAQQQLKRWGVALD